jgi:exonuclease III
MHIITWNIKHGGTYSLLTKIINNLIAHDPDIIVLTEYKQKKGAHLRDSLKTTGWRYQVTSSLNESENSVLIASKKVLKIWTCPPKIVPLVIRVLA